MQIDFFSLTSNSVLRCITKLGLDAIFKQNNFFKFYCKNVNVFIFSYFEPNFIEKFYLEKWFFKYWSRDYFPQNDNSFFETQHFFNVLFADL